MKIPAEIRAAKRPQLLAMAHRLGIKNPEYRATPELREAVALKLASD